MADSSANFARSIATRLSTFHVGLAVGIVLAIVLVGVRDADERWIATTLAFGSAAIVALLAWALGHQNRSARSFAAACAGIAVATYLAYPLDHLRIAWTLHSDKSTLERLRVELNERLARGESLPAYEELATDGEWGLPARRGGRLFYQRRSEHEFELMVGELRDRDAPWGVHRLDAKTGSWRYEDKPFLFVYFEE